MSDSPYPCLWAYAGGQPTLHGRLRSVADDFRVSEELGYALDGQGSHALLWVEKRDTNTEYLAKALGRFAGVRPVDIGYAGLKDRHAVTCQWFSVNLQGLTEPDWAAFNSEQWRVLQVQRHGRKLRTGALAGNRFEIVVRELRGDTGELDARLQRIRDQGVPNYVGEQRFGRDEGNLLAAQRLFNGEIQVRDRHLRGLYLSAARSYLFNVVLSQRVRDDSWQRLLPGEAVMLAGSNSFFIADQIDDTLLQRLHEGDIHPSGPLWGKGEPVVRAEALALEQALLQPYALFCDGLARFDMEQQRRALRLPVRDLTWSLEADRLHLAFTLGKGSFATTVLRELLVNNDINA